MEPSTSASAAENVHSFHALLFDMDGTLIDSTEALVKHWHKVGKELGVDPAVILETSHGRRSIDTLSLYDKSLANWQYISEIEGRIPTEFGQDAVEVPGARALLDSLEAGKGRWAIVTSGTRALLTGWLKVMGLASPEHLVVAEDVEHGKPDPACYQLASKRLGLGSDAAVLVLEDSTAGVRSGKAAGYQVLAVTTTHTVQQLRDAGADWIVPDLRHVVFKGWDESAEKMSIEIAI